MSETLTLKPGSRLRTGGATYEVTEASEVPAGCVPVAPQATRLLKVYCAKCGYTARITQRWIAKGIPACPNAECSDATDTPMIVEATKATKAAKSEAVAAPIDPVEVVPVETWVDEAETELAKLLAEL